MSSQTIPPAEIDPLLVSTTTLFYVKVACMAVIIGVTLTFGFMPLFCSGCRKSSKLLGIANAFSGGLFMGIGLFHLLPEANENFEKYYSTPEGQVAFFFDKPMPYFIAFVSYSLILFLEKVAFDSHSLTEHTHHKENDLDELNEPLLKEEKEEDAKEKEQKDKPLPIARSISQSVKPKQKEDLSDYFNAKKEPNPKDNIFHDCFALKFNRRYSFDNTDTNKKSEIDSDQDENTLKNVVSSKGKFASYLQARNLSKKYNI